MQFRVAPLFALAVISCSSDESSSGSQGGGNDNPSSGGETSGAGGHLNGPEASGGVANSGGQTESGGGNSGGSNSGGAQAGGAPSGGQGTGGAQAGGCEELPPLTLGPEIDCGVEGHIFRNEGPHENRVNYVILGDGYTADMVDSTYIAHIENMLEHEQGMFGALGEPYTTYQKYINICALKVVSADACVDDLDTGLECDTPLGGYGDDASRLGIVDGQAVRGKIAELMPVEVDVDWVAVTINAGSENWWNSGGAIMVWNGGFLPAGNAASVALHEGGHAFHGLADEYDGTSTACSTAAEANVSTDDSGAKWAEWLGFDHNPGTGLHGAYEGARYCETGVYRPTENSEMNLLPDHFNMPSMQKMVHDIYAVVAPIDAHTENSEPLSNPQGVQIRVVDPDVVTIDWSVDGEVVEEDAGPCFMTTGLESGSHTVTVRVYDQTPWVRDSRSDLEQSVSWDVVID